jgi:hypothetical protein
MGRVLHAIVHEHEPTDGLNAEGYRCPFDSQVHGRLRPRLSVLKCSTPLRDDDPEVHTHSLNPTPRGEPKACATSQREFGLARFYSTAWPTATPREGATHVAVELPARRGVGATRSRSQRAFPGGGDPPPPDF